MNLQPLTALSPLDGRYAGQTAPLGELFSEFALFRQRVCIEVRWLRALAADPALTDFPPLAPSEQEFLERLCADFSVPEAGRIKQIEARLRHDLKAVEYFLRERLAEHPTLGARVGYLHFACTSEDINNLCYALALREARERHLVPALVELEDALLERVRRHADCPMPARTHGQLASPTTLGKELAVFLTRLRRQRHLLAQVRVSGKFNGAVGNYSAHFAAYPEVDWPRLTREFILALGLDWNDCTTQVEAHDYMAEYFHALIRLNVILIDLCRDLWGYISLGYFRQKAVAGEIGSSTMPHKINPIDFENAEGNLGLSNALLAHLAENLPLSRWQRDLSDSTRQRNIGAGFGHALLAWHGCRRGLDKLEADPVAMQADLADTWEVLAEAVQTVMRRYGLSDPYTQLKCLSRGRKPDQAKLHELIRQSKLPQQAKQRLLRLTPSTYLGNAPEQARHQAGRDQTA